MPTKTEKKLETFSEDETHQIENSAKLAAEFIEKNILPILTEFEFQNDDRTESEEHFCPKCCGPKTKS